MTELFIFSGQESPPSVPKPQPLSDEQVEQCQRDIISSYKKYKCLIPDSPVKIEDIFINLTKIRSADDRFRKFSDSERLESHNALLDIEVNGQSQKRVMVLGDSCAGRTALCAKIIQDWMNGNGFQQFTMVLLVPLLIPNVTIGEIAKARLSDTNQVTADQLYDYIKDNPDKVLIIVDSLEKSYKKILQECISVWSDEGIPQAQVDHLEIIKILRSDLLQTCFVLVTCDTREDK